MRKTKVNKRKIKYSKKHRNRKVGQKTQRTRGKNKNICEKGVTDEVLKFRKRIKELNFKFK
jgi:hypothetical protein